MMGVVYDITCNDCGEHYIGETARTLEKRLGEHQKQTTYAIQEHQSQASPMLNRDGYYLPAIFYHLLSRD